MAYLQKFYFFRCYHCGEWYYTNRGIKTKKCIGCHRSFQFHKSTKFSKNCSTEGAILILKELKKRREGEDLTKFMDVYSHLIKKNN